MKDLKTIICFPPSVHRFWDLGFNANHEKQFLLQWSPLEPLPPGRHLSNGGLAGSLALSRDKELSKDQQVAVKGWVTAEPTQCPLGRRCFLHHQDSRTRTLCSDTKVKSWRCNG